MMNRVMARGDKAFEEWMGSVWLALKFRMELARQEEWVIFQFDEFDQFSVG